MHETAMFNGKFFFDTYVRAMGEVTIADIGAQDVNGSLRDVAPENAKYIGVDFVQGKGVDVVLTDPYRMPFEDNSLDVVVSSSCFEHSEMFWLLFMDLLRILKPNGLLYINVPSSGAFHRYPVDCWRFYPDSGRALITWARHNGVNAAMLESYITNKGPNDAMWYWNDCVSVFIKDAAHVDKHPHRILHHFTRFTNGQVYGSDELLNPRNLTQDMEQMTAIRQALAL